MIRAYALASVAAIALTISLPQISQAQTADALLVAASQCSKLDECISIMLKGGAARQTPVMQMGAARVADMPKPEKGNRNAARDLNAKALDAIKAKDYATAATLLQQANQADPRDVEVLSNWEFALVKLGKGAEAERVALATLLIDPKRTSAWAPLGEAYDLQGKRELAVSALLVAYEFSGNREKTLSVYAGKTESEERLTMKEVYKAANIAILNNQSLVVAQSTDDSAVREKAAAEKDAAERAAFKRAMALDAEKAAADRAAAEQVQARAAKDKEIAEKALRENTTRSNEHGNKQHINNNESTHNWTVEAAPQPDNDQRKPKSLLDSAMDAIRMSVIDKSKDDLIEFHISDTAASTSDGNTRCSLVLSINNKTKADLINVATSIDFTGGQLTVRRENITYASVSPGKGQRQSIKDFLCEHVDGVTIEINSASTIYKQETTPLTSSDIRYLNNIKWEFVIGSTNIKEAISNAIKTNKSNVVDEIKGRKWYAQQALGGACVESGGPSKTLEDLATMIRGGNDIPYSIREDKIQNGIPVVVTIALTSEGKSITHYKGVDLCESANITKRHKANDELNAYKQRYR